MLSSEKDGFWIETGTAAGNQEYTSLTPESLRAEHEHARRIFCEAFLKARRRNSSWGPALTPLDTLEAEIRFSATWTTKRLTDSKRLQDVLSAVYLGALQECKVHKHFGTPDTDRCYIAQAIVAHVETELLRRQLFCEA